MARKIIHDGPINTAVMAWMRGQGIKPEDVRGYTLTYDAGDLMTIDIRMIMEDVAPKPANPPFVVDDGGNVWTYDAPRDGYRMGIGTRPCSLDYIREHYGIAEFQPPHATCHNVTSPGDSVLTWMCGVGCKPVCLCGSRSPDPQMHDVIACPIGSAEYERDSVGVAHSKTWPARVRDVEGDVFAHQSDGVYRMVLDGGLTGLLGDNTYTLDEIGPHSAIEGDPDAASHSFAARFTANGVGVESWIMERAGSKGIQARVVQALIDATPLNPEGLTESEIHRMVYAVTTPSLERSTWKRVWQAVTDGQGHWRDVVFPHPHERRWIAERPRDASDS